MASTTVDLDDLQNPTVDDEKRFRICVRKGEMMELEDMLKKGFPVNKKMRFFGFPFGFACKEGTASILSLMLDYGADWDRIKDPGMLVYILDMSFMLTVHSCGSDMFVKLFKRGLSPFVKVNENQTQLECLLYNHPSVLDVYFLGMEKMWSEFVPNNKVIVNKSYAPEQRCLTRGFTHSLANGRHDEAIEIFEKVKIDPNHIYGNSQVSSVLRMAFDFRAYSVAKYLLDNGADASLTLTLDDMSKCLENDIDTQRDLIMKAFDCGLNPFRTSRNRHTQQATHEVGQQFKLKAVHNIVEELWNRYVLFGSVPLPDVKVAE